MRALANPLGSLSQAVLSCYRFGLVTKPKRTKMHVGATGRTGFLRAGIEAAGSGPCRK